MYTKLFGLKEVLTFPLNLNGCSVIRTTLSKGINYPRILDTTHLYLTTLPNKPTYEVPTK